MRSRRQRFARMTPNRQSETGYMIARPRRNNVKFVPRKVNLSPHGRIANKTTEPDNATPLIPRGKPMAKLRMLTGEANNRSFRRRDDSPRLMSNQSVESIKI